MNRRDFLRVTGIAGVAAAVGFRADGPDIISGVEVIEEEVEINLAEWQELVNRGFTSRETMMEKAGLTEVWHRSWDTGEKLIITEVRNGVPIVKRNI